MRRRILSILLSAQLVLPIGGEKIQAQNVSSEPQKFFHDFIVLHEDEMRQIREGKPVAKILDSPTADQVSYIKRPS
jgi:hypothetical protein